MSVFAIGDIHGESAKLDVLLAALPRTADDTTIFLGDYLDRGPDCAAVVRRVLGEHAAAPDRTILLWGNHEDMAAGYFGLANPSEFTYDPYDWFRNGGLETLASFGYTTPGTAFRATCPAELTQLFGLLRLFWYSPDRTTLFVHAGILPWQDPETTSAEVLLWVRNDFIATTQPPGRLVVFGHTPQRSGRPLVLADKIGIDTAAAYGGPLTALQLPERHIWQSDGAGQVTVSPLPAP